MTLALGLLTVANALLYGVAAILHWGVEIRLGSVVLAFPEAIPPATIVEGVIALGLALAAVALLGDLRSAGSVARWAYVVALIGTVFGLTIALLRGLEGPDIWVHFLMLGGLAAGFAILIFAAPLKSE
jgi:hypothetical protein